jgi:hypothetical protein
MPRSKSIGYQHRRFDVGWDLKGDEGDVQDTVISSPAPMSRYALIAMDTPAREKRTKEFGLHAWFILYYSSVFSLTTASVLPMLL